ncbi:hypothetical protein G6011_01016 [Alternaria panax]|uniref:BTB domain-containing protein n=1 Tax=Alternaria panax TaxID=48097 RepID=A0AAD4NW66_9PLEO|nr:hypothetical protein G6011_01016 [Alternaria panax]
MGFEIVTVCVGETDAAVNIPVYRDQLSAVSHYFRDAFEGGFKDAENRFLLLVDVSKQTFKTLLRRSATKILEESTTAHGELKTAKRKRIGSHTRRQSASMSAIDERGGSLMSIHTEQMEVLCWDNQEGLDSYGLMLFSFLRLYVFADKYNVPQLRDDVFTALIAQSSAWKAVPHSCVLHEEQCRKRIRDHPHIFTARIDACVQDTSGMAEERDEE